MKIIPIILIVYYLFTALLFVYLKAHAETVTDIVSVTEPVTSVVNYETIHVFETNDSFLPL